MSAVEGAKKKLQARVEQLESKVRFTITFKEWGGED